LEEAAIRHKKSRFSTICGRIAVSSSLLPQENVIPGEME
jgi:hypothetical protein